MRIKIYNLKIHFDERGWLGEILRDDILGKKVAQVYISYSVKDAIRGGHYHKIKTEWFFVISGEAEIYLKDLDTNEENVLKISATNPILLEIPPRVVHKIKSQSELYLLVGTDRIFNEDEPDTYLD